MRATTKRTRRLLWSGWLVASAVAIVDLFVHLGHAGWRTDEPVYRNAAAAIASGNWSHNLEHPLVGKYLIMAARAALGDGATATRMVSAIAALLTGLVLAALAARVLRDSASSTTCAWAALATFVTWTLLPHPDPSFDVTRLAYLDAPMALCIACAMYAGWRWQEAWSWRWAGLTGVAAGLAVATKVPALFLAPVLLTLVVMRSDASRTVRARQYVLVAVIAAGTTVSTWLPLRGDLPEALRFLVAMQRRDVDQTIEVAGRTYQNGAPIWSQAWWQWDAWPTFALVQLLALLLAWWILPRRAATFIVACAVLPAVAYAVGGGRILPHWQATWQPATCLLVALVATQLVARAPRRWPVAAIGASMCVIVVVHATERTLAVLESDLSDQQRVSRLLEVADRQESLVLVQAAAAQVERALTRAHPFPWRGTYHSAEESQHAWVRNVGGAPVEPAPPRLALEWSAVSAVVTLAGQSPKPFGRAGWTRHRAGRFDVWLLSRSSD